MPYIDDICLPLIRVLEHNAGLQPHQLAGHVANIDFWFGEVRHCLGVIDGYNNRFEALKSAQADYERQHPHAIPDPAGWSQQVGRDPPLKKTSKDSDRQRLRRELLAAADRFLARAEREGLVDPSCLFTASAQCSREDSGE